MDEAQQRKRANHIDAPENERPGAGGNGESILPFHLGSPLKEQCFTGPDSPTPPPINHTVLERASASMAQVPNFQVLSNIQKTF